MEEDFSVRNIFSAEKLGSLPTFWRTTLRWASTSMHITSVPVLIGLLATAPSVCNASEPGKQLSTEFSSCIADAKGVTHAIQ